MPSAVPDPLALAGKVFAIDHYDVAALADAIVELRARADDALLASATTTGEGVFAFSIASHGAPVDATLVVTAAGFLPTRADPGEPFAAGDALANVLLAVAREDELARWYADAGAAYAANARTVVAATVDCARHTIAGATLTVAPPTAAVTYYNTDAKHWDPGLAASTNGFTLVTGAAPQVAATTAAASQSFPARMLAVDSGALTLAVLAPRVP